MIPRAQVCCLALLSIAVTLGLAACNSFMHGFTADQYTYRVLPLSSRDGARRFDMEFKYDATIRAFVEDHGHPDYLYLRDVSNIGLIYIERDEAAWFRRTALSSDSQTDIEEPIPKYLLASIAPEDRARIREIRGALPARESSGKIESRVSAANVVEREPSSSGTCFAVRPDGLIMTAYHVVMNAKEISVQLSDRRIYPALVESVSSLADLALLRIEASNLDFLSLAPIRSSSVGDHVFTLGFPAPSLLGLEPRFTDGSISALSGPGGEAGFLQMSVPVHPGNSGGPLVNDLGEVVGVVIASTAALPFLSATGSLPQNMNWATKSDYGVPLFDPPPRRPSAATRKAAIHLTAEALCLVVAKSPSGAIESARHQLNRGTTLSEGGLSTLQALAKLLNRYHQSDVIIRGHTDSEGDKASNRKLSEVRADAIRTTLIAEGVSPRRLTSIGFGESMPAFANDTRQGRQLNRRVEVDIRPYDEILWSRVDYVGHLYQEMRTTPGPGSIQRLANSLILTFPSSTFFVDP